MDFHIYNRLIHWNQCHVIYFSTKTGERAARWKSKIATRSLEKEIRSQNEKFRSGVHGKRMAIEFEANRAEV